MIKPDSHILEFGPAHGRLTKYLKEELNSDITIVEIDDEAGEIASQYANKSYIGKTKGNIETFYWEQDLEGKKFDYIIFADVLEHLYNPKKVLKKSSEMLKEDGSILLSIPNVAHNSVIIDLINNEFNYRDVGLLDDTHIRFFTNNSFKRLVTEVGLNLVREEATYAKVDDTEFNNCYNQISKNISKELRKRNEGNIYQYIFELKQNEYNKEIPPLRYVNYDKYNAYEFVAYFKEGNNEYSENRTIRKQICPDIQNIELDLSGLYNIDEIRIDPIDTNCVLEIKNIYGLSADQVIDKINIISSNATYNIDNIFLFDTLDPQLYLDLKHKNVEKLILQFGFIDYDIQDMNIKYKIVNQLWNKLKISDESNLRLKESELLKLQSNQANIDRIEKRLKEQRDLNVKLEETIKEISGKNAELKEKIEEEKLERKKHIEKNNQEIEESIEKTKRLEEKIAQEQEKTKQLEEKIANEQEKTKQLEVRIAQEQEEIKKLEEKIAQEQEKIKEIELNLDIKEEELKQIKGSRIWKSMTYLKRRKN
jgi:2-polyprenyl-3-methyl-5-hydroxy-6-metoxy-1,4-benzoquinol methylase